ncbi:MAG: hypothetical protein BWK78_00830 [Thiotrichaceae bacterium IS1]|nr:MAG: hypothetical protein BWK78_00830 [Thiotrichaceae bacterium IS1]
MNNINAKQSKKRLLIILSIVIIMAGLFATIATQPGQKLVNWVRAGSAFNRGVVVMLWDNDYERAIEYYNEAISLNPNFARAYYKRGEVHFKKGEELQAIGKSHAEESSMRYKQEIVAYYKEEAQKAYTEALEEYKVAVVDLTSSLTKEPNFVQSYLTRGIAYYRLKEYQKTLEDTTKALEFNPKLPEALLHRGLAKFGLGNFAEAVEDYEQMLKLLETNSLYLAYSELKVDLMFDAYSKLKNKNKHKIFNYAFLNLAHAYSKLNKEKQAILNYELAFDLDINLPIPEDALAYLVRGKAYFDNSNVKLLSKLNSDVSDAIFTLNTFRSSRDFNRAIELDPTLVEAYLGQASLHLEQALSTPDSEEEVRLCELTDGLCESLDAEREDLDPDFIKQQLEEKVKPRKLKEENYQQADNDCNQALFYAKQRYKFQGVIGVSLEINKETKLPTIVGTIEGSPAWQAGIKTGDRILMVDQHSTVGMELDETSKLIRGEPDTSVSLRVNRQGKEEFNVQISRVYNSILKGDLIDPIIDTGSSYILNLDEVYEKCASIRKHFNQKQAIQDLRTTASLFQQFGKTADYERIIKEVQELEKQQP